MESNKEINLNLSIHDINFINLEEDILFEQLATGHFINSGIAYICKFLNIPIP
jgi:hypothetical protein